MEAIDTSSTRSLLPNHREHLASSGLNEQTIRLAGLYSITSEGEARQLLWRDENARVPVPAIVFPYGGEYARLRPDTPRAEHQPEAAKVGSTHAREVAEAIGGLSDDEPDVKLVKYEAPTGITSRIYIPRAVQPAIDDPTVPLYLTEGEKKALAGCQAGLAVVAAPGVDCFGNSYYRKLSSGLGEDRRELHPDLAALRLTGRQVVILFDSDIDSNDRVLGAAVRLGKMLDDAGADACITYINSEDGRKVGLDDFYAALPDHERTGPNPLGEIEDAVRPFNPVAALEWLEEQWDGLTASEQARELRRATRLAGLLMRDNKVEGWISDASKRLKVPKKDIRRHLPPKPTKSKKDPRVWLAAWMEENKVRYDPRTNAFSYQNNDERSEDIFRTLALDSLPTGIGRKSLEDAFELWKREALKRNLAEVVATIQYRPRGEYLLRKYIRAITGKEDTVDIAVLKHFIWQVKRKMLSLPVEHHMMPVITGRQGCGKSIAVVKLLGPVQAVVDPAADLAFLSDERQLSRLAESYVVFCDEMPKISTVDVDTLKQRLTAETLKWRVLGANRHETAPNRATFIGAANRPLKDILFDPTGVRRFYQISAAPTMDWDAINSIDYAHLWQSVDAHEPAPVREHLSEISRRQEEWRVKDPVEEFLETCCDVGGAAYTPAGIVYRAFKRFSEDQSLKPGWWTATRFGTRLKELVGPEGEGWKRSGGIKYRVSVTRDSYGNPCPLRA